jgi:hypothetical protein
MAIRPDGSGGRVIFRRDGVGCFGPDLYDMDSRIMFHAFTYSGSLRPNLHSITFSGRGLIRHTNVNVAGRSLWEADVL